MMNFLKNMALVLTIIGALNWGLIGLFGFNLVAAIFGDMTVLSRIVYSIVGISAVVTALTYHRCEIFEELDVNECTNCGL